jgi:hypothetical protein
MKPWFNGFELLDYEVFEISLSKRFPGDEGRVQA